MFWAFLPPLPHCSWTVRMNTWCLQQCPSFLRDIERRTRHLFTLWSSTNRTESKMQYSGSLYRLTTPVCWNTNNSWLHLMKRWHRTQCCYSWTSRSWHNKVRVLTARKKNKSALWVLSWRSKHLFKTAHLPELACWSSSLVKLVCWQIFKGRLVLSTGHPAKHQLG